MATAHVLVFPFPIQGHINCMLHFATTLVDAGVHVTFLHTEHNLRRLGGRASSAAGSPRLRFLAVPDGLPDDHPRSASALPELYKSLAAGATGPYRALLAPSSIGTSLAAGAGVDLTGGFPPVTCLVADGLLPWAIDVAEELRVPAIVFRTASAGSFLAFLSAPKLFELGELPFPAGSDLDEPVSGVPGMESFLRRRDLPGHCRRNDTDDVSPALRALAKLSADASKARALILNTTATLERSALAHIAPRMQDLFAREDDGCMAWLDGLSDKSVVYASLGSLATISREQFTEFFSGLVAAGYPFLWVLRSDMVKASPDAAALREAVVREAGDGKARVVAWAPQRDVLRHRAMGCFLTHAGWNSTLEAVVAGVPTVCRPISSDQQTNSRFVGAVWRTGLDMKDVCDRAVVERTVREAMESGEIRRSAQALLHHRKAPASFLGFRIWECIGR
uniref:Glycosyltransferase n=1 Tax=Setaria italica TaxID=4555 RepID=K4A0T5_SETIT